MRYIVVKQNKDGEFSIPLVNESPQRGFQDIEEARKFSANISQCNIFPVDDILGILDSCHQIISTKDDSFANAIKKKLNKIL